MSKTQQWIDEPYRRGHLSRRQLARLLGGAALTGAIGGGLRPAGAAAATSTFRAVELNHVALRVSDVERSAEFYRRHLGMEVVLDRPFAKFLGCGPHFVALFRGDTPGLDHLCVTIPEYSQEDAVARLSAAGLEPETEENRTYFDDPDGIQLQIESPRSWPGGGPRPRPPE